MKYDRKRILKIAAVAAGILIIGALCVVLGRPLVEFLAEPEAVRAWTEKQGLLAPLCFMGFMAIQIVLAFIPGEPLEIAAGYAFGAVQGTVLCMVGAAIGSLIVFLFVRRYGMRIASTFVAREKIESIGWLKDERKLSFFLTTLFLIPGTPKDVMTYAVGLTAMKLPKWMAISTFARIPSIVTSTISGDALGMGQNQLALIVFGATLLVSAAGLLIYRRVSMAKQ